MLPGPIFSLEMLTSVRRTRYFVIRALYAAVLFLFMLIVYSESSIARGDSSIGAVANLSAGFFFSFSVLQVLAVVALGPAMAAGTIALERERRTIEYLFASPLTNVELVLGKLLARLIHVGYLVLVGLPILALAMLMGGIAPEALLMLFALTLSTMVFVAVLSITISIFSRRAREAVVRTYLLLLVLFLLPPVIFVSLNTIGNYDPWIAGVNDQLLAANPFWVLLSLIRPGGGVQPWAAWEILGTMVLLQGGFSLVALTGSTLVVRRVHLASQGKGEKKRRRRYAWRRPAVGDHPLLWKEMHAEPAAARLGAIGRIAMGLIVLGIFIPTAFMLHNTLTRYGINESRNYIGYTVFMGTAVCCGGLLLIAARAAFSITSEKERDTWGALLSTPLEPREFIYAKAAGNLYASRWIFFLLALLWGLGVILEATFLLAVFFMVLTFLVLSAYASSLGVFYSLRCKNSMRAMGATLLTGIFFGGGYLLCCAPFIIATRAGEEAQIVFTPFIPFLLAFPGVVYFEGANFSHRESPLFAAYLLGLIGYGIATVVLINNSINRFDHFSGRTVSPWRLLPPQWKPSYRLAPAPEAETPLLAEAVDQPPSALEPPP